VTRSNAAAASYKVEARQWQREERDRFCKSFDRAAVKPSLRASSAIFSLGSRLKEALDTIVTSSRDRYLAPQTAKHAKAHTTARQPSASRLAPGAPRLQPFVKEAECGESCRQAGPKTRKTPSGWLAPACSRKQDVSVRAEQQQIFGAHLFSATPSARTGSRSIFVKCGGSTHGGGSERVTNCG